MAHPRADRLAAMMRDEGMSSEHRAMAMFAAETVVASAADGLTALCGPGSTFAVEDVVDLLRTLAGAIHEIGAA